MADPGKGGGRGGHDPLPATVGDHMDFVSFTPFWSLDPLPKIYSNDPNPMLYGCQRCKPAVTNLSSPRIISCLYLGSKKVVQDVNIDW